MSEAIVLSLISLLFSIVFFLYGVIGSAMGLYTPYRKAAQLREEFNALFSRIPVYGKGLQPRDKVSRDMLTEILVRMARWVPCFYCAYMVHFLT